MRKIWKIFTVVALSVLGLAIVLPAAIYALLSIEPVQNAIKEIASDQISEAIGVDVEIEELGVQPFNKIAIRNIRLINHQENDTIATIGNVQAGVELVHFLRTKELIVDYALVEDADINLWKLNPQSPLNIQLIIDHLGKNKKEPSQSAITLRLNTVVLLNSSLTYDILELPQLPEGKFDPNHIRIEALSANAFIPEIKTGCYDIELEHLSFQEKSGFMLNELKTHVQVEGHNVAVQGLDIALPGTKVQFEPIEFNYKALASGEQNSGASSFELETKEGCQVYLPDFKAFVPKLGAIDTPVSVYLKSELSRRAVNISRLSLASQDSKAFTLELTGNADNENNALSFEIQKARLNIEGRELARVLAPFIKSDIAKKLSTLGAQDVLLSASGAKDKGNVNLKSSGTIGSLNLLGTYHRTGKKTGLDISANTRNLNPGELLGLNDLKNINANIKFNGELGRFVSGLLDVNVESCVFKEYTYSNINATADFEEDSQIEIKAAVNDPCALANAYALISRREDAKRVQATLVASNIDLYCLGFDSKHPGHALGLKMNSDIDFTNKEIPEGFIHINDIKWTDSEGKGLKIDNINVASTVSGQNQSLQIYSDFLNANIRGQISLKTLVPQARNILAEFVPAVISQTNIGDSEKINDFTLEATLLPSLELTRFLSLPIHVLDKTEIDGRFNSETGHFSLSVDAPYLMQGSKILEKSNVYITFDAPSTHSSVYLATQFNTNKGQMSLTGLITAHENSIDSRLDWMIQRDIPLNGTLAFNTLLSSPVEPVSKNAVCPLPVKISFNPGSINFGDETWLIKPSVISADAAGVYIDGFGLSASDQAIDINGVAGRNENDKIEIDLKSISLLPIFETLEINNALISGCATGTFTAKNIFGDSPQLTCPRLHVDGIGYNRCTIGNADIEAHWDNDAKAFAFDADIEGLNKQQSRIAGKIFPMAEALDIDFYANEVPVGFLKPFMVAFTSDVSGRASGHCRLFGTFKDIDLEGRIMAHDVCMKIDFTNTSYTANDSVIIEPGIINLDNIVIRDSEGHQALLNGYVKHKCFHEPVFKFDISHAHDFLSFNATPKQYPDWYGRIYGNGGASISGYPGVVNIDVDMATAPGSNFTFVLSDRLDAESFNFINFHDVTPGRDKSGNLNQEQIPDLVRDLKNRGNDAGQDTPSAYNMDIKVDITKDAAMTLVMDPVGGDEINATGEGNLHLAYHSVDNSLNIWGSYKVLTGDYRFTLQDIIIKDFKIKEGSEIRFDGDPYAVKTNLAAYYATNANLTDLDESFQQDKDISRTNVPVHALMLVSGDIRQPNIDFDLEFPTLSSDTYRKVRSIVSTADMMNRQIIYLLALNRFYTPDYMASTTKGSELFSVASSTMASQLGNMLGKLSDNWSIAPNLRSDRGDFSDVEVDLALSSRLLNNRLLFNGNFGYRDKSLNNNQFIGDFDIEYLMNKRGSWRLKAYNRYNDRNFYVRSAQTTQGVGLVFRRDFDDFLSFLRKFRKHKTEANTNDTDSVR